MSSGGTILNYVDAMALGITNVVNECNFMNFAL